MDILNQINNYVKVFMENVEDQRLTEMQTPIMAAIESSNAASLITALSELKPQIAHLEQELRTRNLEIASRNGKIDASDNEFDRMAQERGISKGKLLVNLGNDINAITRKKELTDNAITALKSWTRIMDHSVESKVGSMADEEKQQLYSDLTNVMRQNESSIDLLDHEIAHRELQTDEEIQATATRSGKTFDEVKYGLELEVMQRNLRIARLEEQNNVISGYKTPLIQTVAVEVHRPR